MLRSGRFLCSGKNNLDLLTALSFLPDLEMAVAYWNLVLSGRFKFLDLWNTFLLVSVPLLLAVCAQCEEGGLQVMWLSILPNQSITCGHCGKREVLYRDHQVADKSPHSFATCRACSR